MAAATPLWRRAASAVGRLADQMPARQKTSSERKAHLAAIDKIVQRWLDGEISTAEKREQIARENSFWYGRERKSPATGELLTSADSEVSHVARQAPDDDDEHEEPWWQK